MTHPRRPSLSDPLSVQWRTVIGKYQISEQLARALRFNAITHKKISGMRINEREEKVVEYETAPKPLYVKLKLSNWLLGGAPVDQANLAKTFNNIVKPGEHTSITAEPESAPSLIRTATRRVSIQEIQHGIRKGSLTVDKEKMKSKSNFLVLKPVPGFDKNPSETTVALGVDLSPSTRVHMKDAGVKYNGPKLETPSYWTKEMGDFDAAQEHVYPAFYQVNNGEFKEYKVYMRPRNDSSDAPLLLLDKDNDGFMSTVNLNEYRQLPPEAKEQHNTFTTEGMQKMVDALIRYETYLLKQAHPDKSEIELHAMVMNNVNKYNLAAFGSGSATDCYFVNQMNQGYESPSLAPMQHALENCNRGVLSNLDEEVLWINPEGEPFITYNENEHIAYLLRNGKDQAFYVNPRWNLLSEKWGPVMDMLLKNGVKMDHHQLLAYIQQHNTAERPIDLTILALMLAQAESEGLNATHIRAGIALNLAKHFNQLSVIDTGKTKKIGEVFSSLKSQADKIDLASKNPDRSKTLQSCFNVYETAQAGYDYRTQNQHEILNPNQPSSPRRPGLS